MLVVAALSLGVWCCLSSFDFEKVRDAEEVWCPKSPRHRGELSGCGLLCRKIASESELNGETVISLAASDECIPRTLVVHGSTDLCSKLLET